MQGALAVETEIGRPEDVALDADDNLYVRADARVWRVDALGRISLVAGSYLEGFGADGIPAQAAQLGIGFGSSFSPEGDLYLSDTANNRVRAIKAPFPVDAAPGQLLASYAFKGSLSDDLGGPDLIAAGGQLTESSYTFGPNQGLSLSSPFTNGAEYSVEMVFSLADLSGRVKLLDLSNLQQDGGLHVGFQAILARVELAAPELEPNLLLRLVWTRNALPSELSFYLKGQPLGTSVDARAEFLFRPGAVLHLLVDDFSSNQQETSGGSIERLRLYNGVLSLERVAGLLEES